MIRDRGDIDAALKDAETRLETTYSIPHLAQAPMELPVAPAMCNAIHAASGKRIRRLPIDDQLAG